MLEKINCPGDIKGLSKDELNILAKEIREFLVKHVSKTGGHLASNLGVVEITLALHKVFDTPKDKFIWDVGHQSYVHKILTGRKDKFDKLRQIDGIAGFPKISESEHDAANTGHSSTSISQALGMAKARDLNKEDNNVVAIIGDGALTGGISYEALNHAGKANTSFIVVLNDNEMSISKNVGGMPEYLNKIRTQPIYFKVKEDIDVFLDKIPAIGETAKKALKKVKGSIKYMVMPGIIFEELGFKYLGPVNGHDIGSLLKVLEQAKGIKGPVIIHAITKKGEGYKFAEENPDKFHGIGAFDVDTGETVCKRKDSYSKVFGESLLDIARVNPKVVAISAAMPGGTKTDMFAAEYPERFFDVGIAEQHAVTFAAGMASGGMVPVCAIYSSFFQRAYDQILHDVALPNLHVVFAVDRAGVVGEDGETHQGIYDMSYFRNVPNLTILAPIDYKELRCMMDFAINEVHGPVAVRYPRGSGEEELVPYQPIEYQKGVKLSNGNDVFIVGIGRMVSVALSVKDRLEKLGLSVSVVNARFVKPLDEELICKEAIKCDNIFLIEDNVECGGFGSGVLEMLSKRRIYIKNKIFAWPDKPLEQGACDKLFERYNLTDQAIANDILNILGKGV
ncbi:MAG: 1-deoxy-D-xylulose-5-phosphate synthase [Clostridiales bacterium]|nr:1-deoxy-D-xylulose-5-phosphate synthase [Clostridiales bacterium]